MQITEDTARHLGITNLLDPGQNVLAGARYLDMLKSKLPARIQEPIAPGLRLPRTTSASGTSKMHACWRNGRGWIPTIGAT
jgi:membrane-bound lytic murein transglycosylase F